MKPSNDYYESLPKKRMGAGCLFFNDRDELLLVKPNYKPGWEIPGGIVEQNESPKQCCLREVLEEIGLDREIGPLLTIDYNSQVDTKTESLMFVFDGGVLSESEIGTIQIQEAELCNFAFFAQDNLPEALTITLKSRVLAACKQRSANSGIYLENQCIV
jgi:ADP-ribose pyrophosphatase YjhB (NUDIX family)